MCPNNYATEINKQTNNMNVTQVVDIDHCRIKAAMENGMAFAVLDKETKQVCLSRRKCSWLCDFKLNPAKSSPFLFTYAPI